MRRLLLALALLFFAGSAWAGCTSSNSGYTQNCATEAEADAMAANFQNQSWLNGHCPGGPDDHTTFVKNQTENSIRGDITCGGSGVYVRSWAVFWLTDTPVACSARTDIIRFPTPGPAPASVCHAGCTYAYDASYGGSDGLGPVCDWSTSPPSNCYLPYSTAGAAASRALAPNDPRFAETCSVAEGEQPGKTTSDSDADGIPNDQDADNVDTDGDGTPNSKDPFPNDPTNGKDTGPGDESDNTTSGGGNCASPPVSTGDAIAAQTAFQTWATRCAVEALRVQVQKGIPVTGSVIVTGGSNAVVSGGQDCQHEYTVTGGDPVDVKALVEAQRARCEAKANRTADEEGAGNVGEGEAPGTADLWESGEGFEANQDGLGWGSTPPVLSLRVQGVDTPLPYRTEFVDLIAMIRAMVIAFAGLICFYILAGIE